MRTLATTCIASSKSNLCIERASSSPMRLRQVAIPWLLGMVKGFLEEPRDTMHEGWSFTISRKRSNAALDHNSLCNMPPKSYGAGAFPDGPGSLRGLTTRQGSPLLGPGALPGALLTLPGGPGGQGAPGPGALPLPGCPPPWRGASSTSPRGGPPPPPPFHSSS